MKKLLISGVILFLLGLLTGVAVPLFENSRMGLSAHLAAVQNALVLWAFAFMWQYVNVSAKQLKICLWLSIYSMYSIWLSLVFAAIWGTSKATPIAGAGYVGEAYQEWVVNVLIYSGSVAIIVATVQILLGLLKCKRFSS